jgi:hypothetical protein
MLRHALFSLLFWWLKIDWAYCPKRHALFSLSFWWLRIDCILQELVLLNLLLPCTERFLSGHSPPCMSSGVEDRRPPLPCLREAERQSWSPGSAQRRHLLWLAAGASELCTGIYRQCYVELCTGNFTQKYLHIFHGTEQESGTNRSATTHLFTLVTSM